MKMAHEMKQAIETMKRAGYKVYATKGHDFISTERSRGGWVFAITPNDKVLYVQRGEFGGWEISLQYTPSRQHGSGCRANDMQPYAEITPATLEDAERENLKFARQLRATLYKSSEDWRRGYWTELVQL
jgi:hypothetical protein